MKYFGLITLILGLTFYSCSHHKPKTDKSEKQTEELEATEVSKNREEIQRLIRQVLIWSDSKGTIDLLPALSDSKGSVYIGFDLDKLKINLDKLRQTGFFTTEFIENYNQIIQTLDKKLRNKEFKDWLVGDLPTFNFVNDINPWCLCQGFSPEDFDDVEIIKINSISGELKWKWKKGSSWNDFIFRVKKEDNKWEISYMEGFDFNACTR
jgi:hypothetical protein